MTNRKRDRLTPHPSTTHKTMEKTSFEEWLDRVDLLSNYKPMTEEDKFTVIQRHKHYITFELCGGDFEKGDRVIVGDSRDTSDRRLATIKRVSRQSLVTECGLTFKRDYFGSLITEDGIKMFSVDTTYKWLNPDLPLDDICLYLAAKYGCDSYQFSASVSNFHIFGFRGGSAYPSGRFIVRRDSESALSKKRVDLNDDYDRREHPDGLVIKFEEVRSWLDARIEGEVTAA